MPFAFEVLHLASGKGGHNLTKRKKTFCLVPGLRRAFNEMGPSDVGIHTLQIQRSSSEEEKEEEAKKMEMDGKSSLVIS